MILPAPAAGTSRNARSLYHKELDREAWTHAVVSVATVLEMDGAICRSGARGAGWSRAHSVASAQSGSDVDGARASRRNWRRKPGAAAIEGAQPLAKNKYKLPLTKNLVKRTLLAVSA